MSIAVRVGPNQVFSSAVLRLWTVASLTVRKDERRRMPALSYVIDREDERPLKLMDGAYNQLENMIVTGVLKPGQWVSETELIEASGFSRAPVRSAIQRLSDQQLIAVYPRRGAQICPLDYTQQFRALELRRVVERLLARSASKRADQKQREEFSALVEAFRAAAKTGDQTRMTELDSLLFALTLEAADNAFAAKAMTSVKGLSRRFWVLHQEAHGDTAKMANAHADVAEAIAADLPEKAEAAVDALIDYVEQFTLQVIGYNPIR